MAASEKNTKEKDDAARVRNTLLIFILIVLCACFAIFYSFSQDKPRGTKPQFINTKIDDKTPTTDAYFKNADPAVYQLARKIEIKELITQEELKALPKGALNTRYGDDITLLFLALTTRNLHNIDILLAAGADPYMADKSQGSVGDFTYYTATVTMVKPDYTFDPEAT